MHKKLFSLIHQSWMVVFFCIGIIVGTVVGLVFRINYFTNWVWLLAVGLIIVVAYLKPRMILVVLVLMAGIIVALFRIASELNGEDYIRQFYGQKIVVSGIIKGDPVTDESGTKIKMVNLRFGGVESQGSIYVSLTKNEELKRGDELELTGNLSEGFGTYAGYLYRPTILKWERSEPGDLIVKIRDWFAERVRGLVPEPEVDLGLSYLMGMKSGLPDDLSESLRIVGLTHIVVASGAHLSILVEIARKLFGKISRFAGLLFSILFVLFFMSMVGWTPSILRAGIMAILTIVTWYVGRKIAPWRMILMVAAFTLVLNPMFVVDLGWLLSFASYAGIMILGPRLTKFFYGSKKPGFVASMIIVTVAATLMTLPIVLYFYGTMSLISVIANLLILPTLPYAMGLTFLTGVVAGVPGIEMVVSFLTTKMLGFHIAVVEWFGEMRSFLVEIPAYQWQVFSIYGLFLLIFIIKFKHE